MNPQNEYGKFCTTNKCPRLREGFLNVLMNDQASNRKVSASWNNKYGKLCGKW